MSASQYRKHRVQQAPEREQAHLESLLQTVLEECRNLQRNQALLHEKLDQVSGHVNQLRLAQVKSLGWSPPAEGWADAAGQGNGLTNSPSAQCQVEKTLWKPLARKAVTVQTDLVGNEFDWEVVPSASCEGGPKSPEAEMKVSSQEAGGHSLAFGTWRSIQEPDMKHGLCVRIGRGFRPTQWCGMHGVLEDAPRLLSYFQLKFSGADFFSCQVGRWHLPLHQ